MPLNLQSSQKPVLNSTVLQWKSPRWYREWVCWFPGHFHPMQRSHLISSNRSQCLVMNIVSIAIFRWRNTELESYCIRNQMLISIVQSIPRHSRLVFANWTECFWNEKKFSINKSLSLLLSRHAPFYYCHTSLDTVERMNHRQGHRQNNSSALLVALAIWSLVPSNLPMQTVPILFHSQFVQSFLCTCPLILRSY